MVRIRKAAGGDVDAIAGVYARAFFADPVMAWAYPREQTRMRGLARLYRAILRWEGIPLGTTFVAEDETGRIVGAAVWRMRGAGANASWRDVPFALAAGRALDHNMGRMIALGRSVAPHPEKPHWYLQILAVDPQVQRTGAGSALVRERLAVADAQRLPAYLETTEPNLPFYARFGFDVTGRLPIEGGPSQFSLLREP